MIEKTFIQALKPFFSKTSFLLGFSGGPDSTALFYLLLKYHQPFEVAHIDHGWRPESYQEAMFLKKLCNEHNIKFHLHKVPVGSFLKGNKENTARDIRLAFFQKISQEQGLGAVLLGHHADDCAEVILQRVFGGAEIYNFKSIQQMTLMAQNLLLLRPFLSLRKEQIVRWLQGKNIGFFNDPGNISKEFLRGRMRSTLIPLLEKEYGKNMTSSLSKVAQTSQELYEFLEELLFAYKDQISIEEDGSLLRLQPTIQMHAFLMKFLIKKFLKPWKLTPSGGLLDALVMHLQKGSISKVLRIKDYLLLIDHYSVKLVSPL